jgi:hypothetical protein
VQSDVKMIFLLDNMVDILVLRGRTDAICLYQNTAYEGDQQKSGSLIW